MMWPSPFSTRVRRRLTLGIAALIVAVVGMQAGGCYYMQAVNGQLEVLRKREPIVRLLEDPELPDRTRERFTMILEARQFATDRLQLPDNDSYRTYTDLERDYVVWNIFAAPEFALEPKTWCFPVVGCVAYRGYFSEASAEKHAAALDNDGYDVFVGGVPAYSTLGRFDDPVLNTMMRWSDADLVATLFHELAHQRLYVKGDTAFNESFATAVAEIGLELWLGSRGSLDELSDYARRDELRVALMAATNAAKTQLKELYASGRDVAVMRARKAELLQELIDEGQRIAAAHGFANGGWLRPPLNNARLASTALYRGDLPAFRAIYAGCDRALECFYAEVDRLGGLDPEPRRAALDALGNGKQTAAAQD